MAKDERKFEQIVSELETIVTELDGSLPLEESLKKFQQGMELAKSAEERLKTRENEFHKIQQQFTPTQELKVESTDEAIADIV
jgi:exodeoxyribonuclease VII small subunit